MGSRPARETLALTSGSAVGPEPAPRASDRNFHVGLGLAILFHAALFVTIGQHRPRQIGTAGGSTEAVSVEIIDVSDLITGSTGPAASDASTAAPDQPAQQAQPPRPAMHEIQQEEPTEKSPSPEVPSTAAKSTGKEEPSKAEPEPQETANVPRNVDAPAAESANEPKQPPAPERPPPAAAKSIESDLVELLKIDPQDTAPLGGGAPKGSAGKSKPQQMAKLDFSPPRAVLQGTAPGSNATFSRPAGITRSGENDDFARGVIRALRQTMPQVDIRGRVTVRLVLTENGSLAKVEVLGSSGDGALVPNVVFSTKQTNFPIPPARSRDVDRIFLITYIYDRDR